MGNGVYEIRGAAGAGKTYQLAEDIRTIVKEHRNVATISFSNAAVDELRSRLGSLPVTLATIHSFCWKVLGSISRRILEYTELLTDFEPKALLNSEYSLNDVKAVRYGELGIPQFECESGLLWLSHDDVISLFVQALNVVPGFTKLLSSAYDYILIDEYQDTNGPFLKALLHQVADYVTIGLYGDPFQSIYLNSQSFQSIVEHETYDIQTYYLPNNYRSQSELVAFFNKSRCNYDDLQQEAVYAGVIKPEIFLHKGSLTPDLVNIINSKLKVEGSIVLSLTNAVRMTAAGFGRLAKQIRSWASRNTRPGIDWSEVLRTDQLNPYVSLLIKYGNLYFGSNYCSVQALFQIFTLNSIQSVSMVSIQELLKNLKNSRVADTQAFLDAGLEFSKEIFGIRTWLDEIDFDRLQQVVEFYNSLSTINSQSMTIFASKGLEFDDVILNIDYGLYRDRNWNYIQFEHNERDTRNVNSDIMSYLFYVGITRAKSNLAIYINTAEHGQFLRQLQAKYGDYFGQQTNLI